MVLRPTLNLLMVVDVLVIHSCNLLSGVVLLYTVQKTFLIWY
jgi:hypothetical protein